MIYLDASVALAQWLSVYRIPPVALWSEVVVSSRLLEYWLWSRLHARRLVRSQGGVARDLMHRVALMELDPAVLARALDPFPTAVRTLDALHLATLDFLQSQGLAVQLASYDARMVEAARRLSVPVYAL